MDPTSPITTGTELRARLAAAAVSLALWSGVCHADELLRVRVAAGVASAVLQGDELTVDGHRLRGGSVSLSAANGQVRIAGKARGDAVVVDARGPLRYGNKSFPGSVRVTARPGGTLELVNVVPLEPYVASAIASETPPDWPDEALKAQAVVARSYALHERDRRSGESFDLESSVISQRYGEGVVPAGAIAAARATEGEILVYDGAPILAAFHSSSGGTTASAEEVWGQDLPYLRSVSSPDDAAPDYFWSYEISVDDLSAALREAGYAPGSLSHVEVTARSDSGRVERIQLGSVLLSGRDLRELLGGRALRSAKFEARVEGDRVRFLGSGSGHGVGLCQWGASELARRGTSYRHILAHYYPGSDLRRVRANGSTPTDWSARR
jgi:stage II sporulation protein D (peptidoglycan lytic transglycosylase)